ncbi:hypothetical protein [Thalassobius sp. MITS945101]|uniref:hypothetical protein n=1 Tax=Thalassobius sp. MITS945101 TaxID=3096994 RepID=UPI00399B920D
MTTFSNAPDTSPEIGRDKPLTLRAIFILNALKVLLTLGFFAAFKWGGFALHGLAGDSAAQLMLVAAAGYAAAFGLIVASILNRQIRGIRTAIVLDLLISIAAGGPIGYVIAAVSMWLSFTGPVKRYFAYR